MNAPPWSNFKCLQFSAKILLNNRFAPIPLWLAPPLENPGFAIGHVFPYCSGGSRRRGGGTRTVTPEDQMFLSFRFFQKKCRI